MAVVVWLIAACALVSPVAQGTYAGGALCIATAAGDGAAVDSGAPFDGNNLPLNSALFQPAQVRVHPVTGAWLIADQSNGLIRGILPSQLLMLQLMGTPDAVVPATSGNGGPASAASVNNPTDVLPLPPSICQPVVSNPLACTIVAEITGCVLRYVNGSGIVSAFMGNAGNCTTIGNGIAAGATSIHGPALMSEVYTAASGALSVAVADYYGCVIRVISLLTRIVTTFAGVADNCTSFGDGGRATSATIKHPQGAVVTPDGTMWISEHQGNKVRRTDKSGVIILTIAGDGSCVPMSPGIVSALAASLCQPVGLAWDARTSIMYVGMLYGVAMLYSNSSMAMLAGADGTHWYSGDSAVIAPRGTGMHAVHGITLDPSGALLVTDYANQRIRVIDRRVCIALSNAFGLAPFPGRLTPAAASNLTVYTADMSSITGVLSLWPYKVAPCLWNSTNATLSSNPSAAGAAAQAAGFTFGIAPRALYDTAAAAAARSATPTIFCDSVTLSIDAPLLAPQCQMLAQVTCTLPAAFVPDLTRMWALIVTLAPSTLAAFPGFPPLLAALPWPLIPTATNGSACINGTIGASRASTVYNGDGLFAMRSRLSSPMSARVDLTSGDIIVTDTGLQRVLVMSLATGFVTTIAGNGTAAPFTDSVPGRFTTVNMPMDAVSLPSYVCSQLAETCFSCVLLADSGNARLRLIRRDASSTNTFTLFGNGTATDAPSPAHATGKDVTLSQPSRLSNAYPCGINDFCVAVVTACMVREAALVAGTLTTRAGIANVCGMGLNGIPANVSSLNSPQAALPMPDGTMWISEYAGHVVRRIGLDGLIMPVAGNGTCIPSVSNAGPVPALNAYLCNPSGMVLHASMHAVLIATVTPTAVRTYNLSTGTINTLAGSIFGDSGDGGLISSSVAFRNIVALSLDPSGAILIADAGNHRIRAIDRRLCYVAPSPQLLQPGQLSSLTLTDARTSNITAVLSLWPYAVAPCLWDTTSALNMTSANTTASAALSVGYSFGVAPLMLVSGMAVDAARSAAPTTQCSQLQLRVDDAALAPACQMLAEVTCVLPQAVSYDTTRAWAFVITLVPTVLSQYPAFTPLVSPLPWPTTPSISNGAPCVMNVLGTGSIGLAVDGVLAGNASVNILKALVTDASSGLTYFSDQFNQRVRTLNASFMVNTFVGNSSAMSSGDGGPGTSAAVNEPSGIVSLTSYECSLVTSGRSIVSSPCVLVGEVAGNRLRYERSDGALTLTVLGNGTSVDTGDGGPASLATIAGPSFMSAAYTNVNGDRVIALTAFSGCRIRMLKLSGMTVWPVAGNGICASGPDAAPATSVSINTPHAVIALPDATLLVADTGNNMIRRIDRDGYMFIVAGNGSCLPFQVGGVVQDAKTTQLCTPVAMALDPVRNLAYITTQHAIRVLYLADYSIGTLLGSPVSGGAPGSEYVPFTLASASLNAPRGIAYDSSGAIVFGDTGNNVLRAVRRYCSSSPVNSTFVVPPQAYAVSSLTVTTASLSAIAAVLSLAPVGAFACLWDTRSPADVLNPAAAMTSNGYAIVAAGTRPGPFPQFLTVTPVSLVVTVDDAYVAPYCQMLCAFNATFSPALDASYTWLLQVSAPFPGQVASSAALLSAVTGLIAPSPSATPTSSATPSQTVTSSGSSTGSATSTSSLTSTGTASASRTGTSTSSSTTTGSSSSSSSYTMTSSRSGTSTMTLSSSNTATTSASSSVSGTASATGSASAVIATTQASSTAMASPSRRPSSQTPFSSVTARASVSSAASMVASAAFTPSSSSSITVSGILSPTSTSSASATSSISITSSVSVAVTAASGTALLSAASTVASSQSPSASGSFASSAVVSSSSVIASASLASAGVSAVLSASLPTRRGVTPSSSIAPLATASGSAAVIATSYVLPSTILISSSTQTSTASLTATGASATMSPVATATPTVTASSPATNVPSVASVSTASATPSVVAATGPLAVVGINSASTLLLCDSLPAVRFAIATTGCSSDDPCSISCSVSNSSRARVFLTSSPSSASAAVALWVPFSTSAAPSATSGLLRCTATSRSTGATASGTLKLQVTDTHWPLLSDVLVHMPGALIKSVWAPPVNLTQRSLTSGNVDDTLEAIAATASSDRLPSQPFTLSVSSGVNVTLVAAVPGVFSNATIVSVGSVLVTGAIASSSGSLLHMQVPATAALCASGECGYQQLQIRVATGGVAVTCPPFCPNDLPGTIPIVTDSSLVAVPAFAGDGTQPPQPVQLAALPSSGLYITQACTAAGFTDPSTGACTNITDAALVRCAFGAGAGCVPCPTGALCPGGYRAWPLPGYYTPTEASGTVLACAPPARRCTGWNASAAATACADGYLPGSYACGACANGFYVTLDGMCVSCPISAGIADVAVSFMTFLGYLAAALLAVYSCMRALAWLTSARTDDALQRMIALASWSFVTVQLVAQAGRTAASGLPPQLLALYAGLSVSQFQGVTLPSACMIGYPYVNEVVAMSAALLAVASAVVLAIIERLRVQSSLDAAPLLYRVQATAFRVCVLVATLLYATAINSALSIVTCTRADIPLRAYVLLDGDGTAARGLGAVTSSQLRSDSIVSVLLQQSNPSHVCYEAAHTSAAAVAWVILFTCGVIAPAAAVLCVYARMRTVLFNAATTVTVVQPASNSVRSQSPSVRHGQSKLRTMLAPVPVGATRSSKTRAAGQSLPSISGVSSLRMVSSALARPASASFFVVTADTDVSIHKELFLKPFVATDYRPSAFAFSLVDRYTILILAAISANLRTLTASRADVITRCVCEVTTLTVALSLLLWAHPYAPVHAWKHGVKALTHVVCILISLCNCAQSLTAPAAIIALLAWLVFAGCVVLLSVLPLAFLYDAIRPPPSTTQEVVAATRQRAIASPPVRVLQRDVQHTNPLLARRPLPPTPRFTVQADMLEPTPTKQAATVRMSTVVTSPATRVSATVPPQLDSTLARRSATAPASQLHHALAFAAAVHPSGAGRIRAAAVRGSGHELARPSWLASAQRLSGTQGARSQTWRLSNARHVEIAAPTRRGKRMAGVEMHAADDDPHDDF